MLNVTIASALATIAVTKCPNPVGIEIDERTGSGSGVLKTSSQHEAGGARRPRLMRRSSRSVSLVSVHSGACSLRTASDTGRTRAPFPVHAIHRGTWVNFFANATSDQSKTECGLVNRQFIRIGQGRSMLPLPSGSSGSELNCRRPTRWAVLSSETGANFRSQPGEEHADLTLERRTRNSRS